MSERPILFSAPMVRAIIDGSKTQTRRIVKPQHLPWVTEALEALGDDRWSQRPFPYGRTGDRLWVRETWSPDHRNVYPCPDLVYRADPSSPVASDVAEHVRGCRAGGGGPPSGECLRCAGFRWRPSIFMPREASRITLEVTRVRVERVQAITEADALAEGVAGLPQSGEDAARSLPTRLSATENYRRLWDEINGKREGRAWKDNPWVWVIDFERVTT